MGNKESARTFGWNNAVNLKKIFWGPIAQTMRSQDVVMD